MKNKDNKCFLWSVLRYLHPIENHEERLTDIRKYENDKFQRNRFSSRTQRHSKV